MVKDLTLLSALEELDESRFKEYLNELKEEFFDNLIADISTEETLRQQGGLRVLKRIITDIETASREKVRLREKENRPEAKHLF